MHPRLETKDTTFRGKLGRAETFTVKEMTDTGEFEGYASTFNNIDGGHDMMIEGAFSESLKTTPAGQVKMLWQHQTDHIIGKYLEIREDSKGLFVHGKLNLKIAKAAEAYELMRDELIDGLSIGYRTVKDEIDRANGVRKLLKVDLREISVVTFPMDRNSTIGYVKGETMPTEREFEALLRDAGFTSKQAKTVISSGYKTISSVRDAGEIEDEGLSKALADLAAKMRGVTSTQSKD